MEMGLTMHAKLVGIAELAIAVGTVGVRRVGWIVSEIAYVVITMTVRQTTSLLGISIGLVENNLRATGQATSLGWIVNLVYDDLGLRPGPHWRKRI